MLAPIVIVSGERLAKLPEGGGYNGAILGSVERVEVRLRELRLQLRSQRVDALEEGLDLVVLLVGPPAVSVLDDGQRVHATLEIVHCLGSATSVSALQCWSEGIVARSVVDRPDCGVRDRRGQLEALDEQRRGELSESVLQVGDGAFLRERVP